MFSPGFLIDKSPDTLSKDFFSIVKSIGKPKKISKGKVVIRYGSHPSFFFFIVAGIFKTTVRIKNKDFILGFTFKGDIDCCPSSLLSGRPNNFNIEAISDGEILVCELKDFQRACSGDEYLTMVNIMLTNYLQVVEKRVIDAISLTAAERYKLLLEKHPVETKQIPLTNIAAYLGITLERLSRIRKKMKA